MTTGVPEAFAVLEPADVTLAEYAETGGTPSCNALPGSRLTVASYNVRYARGPSMIRDKLRASVRAHTPTQRARVIERNLETILGYFSPGGPLAHADVVMLQEVDRGTRRAAGHHLAREFAAQLHLQYVYVRRLPCRVRQTRGSFPSLEERVARHETGDTGIALLSRVRLERPIIGTLPPVGTDTLLRPSITATITVGSKCICVSTAHIEARPSLRGRLAQKRAWLAAVARAGVADAVVLAGDFNTTSRRAQRMTRALFEQEGFAVAVGDGEPTWTAGPIRWRLDWIFTRGVRVVEARTESRLRASDHRPIWATVDASI